MLPTARAVTNGRATAHEASSDFVRTVAGAQPSIATRQPGFISAHRMQTGPQPWSVISGSARGTVQDAALGSWAPIMVAARELVVVDVACRLSMPAM
jgi:hypothetical protein